MFKLYRPPAINLSVILALFKISAHACMKVWNAGCKSARWRYALVPSPLTWLTNHRPSVLWHCWLGHLSRKIVSKMTYNVSSRTLNSTVPYSSASRKLCGRLALINMAPRRVPTCRSRQFSWQTADHDRFTPRRQAAARSTTNARHLQMMIKRNV